MCVRVRGAQITARLMNQPVDATTGRSLLYRGPLDCAVKSVRQEGVRCLTKGLSANAARMGPYTVLVLLFNEQFKSWCAARDAGHSGSLVKP